jgi:FtsH-binding integral membrane protein
VASPRVVVVTFDLMRSCRAAALVYMRLLLCLQGLYLVFLGWLVFLGRDPGASVRWALAFVLVYSVLGVGEIVTAILPRHDHPGVMIAAIVTAALWLVPVARPR